MINRTIIDHRYKLGDSVFTVLYPKQLELRTVIGPFEVTAIMFVLDKYTNSITYEVGPYYRCEKDVFGSKEEAERSKIGANFPSLS